MDERENVGFKESHTDRSIYLYMAIERFLTGIAMDVTRDDPRRR